MINKIRLVLLVMTLCLIVAAGYYLKKSSNSGSMQAQIKFTEKGVDVEIENFNLTHDVLGRKDWELKAGFAQINNAKSQTRLKNVVMTINHDNDQKSWIYADAGILNNETNDVELQGNVRFVAQSSKVLDQFRDKDKQEAE